MYRKAFTVTLFLIALSIPVASQASVDLSGVTTLSPTGNVSISDYDEPITYRVEVNWTEVINYDAADDATHELGIGLTNYDITSFRELEKFQVSSNSYGLLNTTTGFNNIFMFENTTTFSLPDRDLVVLSSDNTTGYVESNPPFEYRKIELGMDIE